ncbi:MAG: hypothetical protein KAS32_23840 [Candidatus Peribacteraceae bacterium]|nr:hypothetical protein [Candidatus Peribacteraceae bacterium]
MKNEFVMLIKAYDINGDELVKAQGEPNQIYDVADPGVYEWIKDEVKNKGFPTRQVMGMRVLGVIINQTPPPPRHRTNFAPYTPSPKSYA